MNKTLLYMAAAAASLGMAAGFTSCDDEGVMPPVVLPGADGSGNVEVVEPTITILELKEAFYDASKNGNDYSTVVGTKEDGTDYIIKGRIVSNTKTGNIYKYVMVEDGTSSMAFSVDNSKLYETVRGDYGAVIAVNVTGLSLGTYRNNLICGVTTEGYDYPARIPKAMWEEIAIPQEIPDPSKVEPYEVTIADVLAYKNNTTELLRWQNRLVKFDDVHFTTPGLTYATAGTNVSRYFADEAGKQLILRNSGSSQWWWEVMPDGTGSITGILGYYSKDWQMQLNDLGGVEGFTPYIPPFFAESFNASLGQFAIENLLPVDPALAAVWKHSSQYTCAIATGYLNTDRKNYDTDSRLVSPELDLTGCAKATAKFDHAGNYFSSVDVMKQQLTFEVSEDGQNWSAVEIPNYPSNSGFTFVNSGEIDLSAYCGKKVKVAFRYRSTSAKAGTWEVNNFSINVEK